MMFPETEWVESPKEGAIRVLIVDDHPFLREGLSAVIGAQPDMTLAGQAGNGREAVDVARQVKPDVVLMDLRMPVLSGPEAIALLREECPGAQVIVLTTYDADEDVHRALQAGARGYLLKGMDRQDVLQAIRAVHGGGRYVPSELEERLTERSLRAPLTPREVEVLELLSRGLRNGEIANALSISEETVKVHVKRILSKLDATDRTEAAIVALRRGLIQ